VSSRGTAFLELLFKFVDDVAQFLVNDTQTFESATFALGRTDQVRHLTDRVQDSLDPPVLILGQNEHTDRRWRADLGLSCSTFGFRNPLFRQQIQHRLKELRIGADV